MGTEFLKRCSGFIRSFLKISLFTIFLSIFAVFEGSAFAKITVYDFRGKSVTLNKPAERVVCLIESALTGIYMLKRGEKIVGVPSNIYYEGFYYSDTFKYYLNLDPRIKQKKIPPVGNWESVNIEKVLSLKPDLIIIWSSQTDAIETFERVGIPVYGVFITKIDDVFKEIRDFGLLLDANSRAEELIRFAKEEIKNLEKFSRKIKYNRRVFFSWSQHNFLQTACGGSIIDEIIVRIGGINICGDILQESQNLTLEKLILLDPEVIIMWYSRQLKAKDVINNNQYRIIKAVREGRIYQFDDTFSYDLWTLKFLYAMKFIAKSVYPEAYSYELENEKRRIINFLYGKQLI